MKEESNEKRVFAERDIKCVGALLLAESRYALLQVLRRELEIVRRDLGAIFGSRPFRVGSALSSLVAGSSGRARAGQAPERFLETQREIRAWEDTVYAETVGGFESGLHVPPADRNGKLDPFRTAHELGVACQAVMRWYELIRAQAREVVGSRKFKLGSLLSGDRSAWPPASLEESFARYEGLHELLSAQRSLDGALLQLVTADESPGSITVAARAHASPGRLGVLWLAPPGADDLPFRALSGALQASGLAVRRIEDLEEAHTALGSGELDAVIVHVDRLELHYRHEDPEEARRRARSLLESLSRVKRAGARLLCSIGDPLPGDPARESVDEEVLDLVSFVAGLVVVPGNAAKLHVSRFVPRDRVEVVPPPASPDLFGPGISKQEARDRLNIPRDAIVFGDGGGSEDPRLLLEAFSRVHAAAPGRDAILLIAADADLPRGETAAGGVKVLPVAATGGERVERLCASDYSVFVLGDAPGSIASSISYGTPVIVPARGWAADVIERYGTGRSYAYRDVSSLAECMSEAADDARHHHASYMCREFNVRCAASGVAKRLTELYRSLARDEA